MQMKRALPATTNNPIIAGPRGEDMHISRSIILPLLALSASAAPLPDEVALKKTARKFAP